MRRIDTFDPVCFLYAPLSHISRAKTVKRSLFQKGQLFSVHRSKNHLHCLDTNKSFRYFRGTQNCIFVNILKKKHFFILLNNNIFCWLNFAVLNECDTFESNSLSLFQVTLSNQPRVLLHHWGDIGQRPSNHPLLLYELLVSVVWLKLSFDEVSKTCKRMH